MVATSPVRRHPVRHRCQSAVGDAWITSSRRRRNREVRWYLVREVLKPSGVDVSYEAIDACPWCGEQLHRPAEVQP